jgi:hypothetical protein
MIWFSVTPGNRLCLWPSTSKQGSGVGHTLNACLGLGIVIIKANKSILLPADEEIIGSS